MCDGKNQIWCSTDFENLIAFWISAPVYISSMYTLMGYWNVPKKNWRRTCFLTLIIQIEEHMKKQCAEYSYQIRVLRKFISSLFYLLRCALLSIFCNIDTNTTKSGLSPAYKNLYLHFFSSNHWWWAIFPTNFFDYTDISSSVSQSFSRFSNANRCQL